MRGLTERSHFALMKLCVLWLMMLILVQSFGAEASMDESVDGNGVGNGQETEVLALPEANEDAGQTLEVGKKISFDSLGPIIVNSDGTTGRITNWEKLSKREQAWTLKRIAERNKGRAEKLASNTPVGEDFGRDEL